jgi:hypothetical protein
MKILVAIVAMVVVANCTLLQLSPLTCDEDGDCPDNSLCTESRTCGPGDPEQGEGEGERGAKPHRLVKRLSITATARG